MTKINPGDVVIVNSDAYSGDVGEMHNGRVCKVLETRDGDVIVMSIDERKPQLWWTHHSPHVLKKVDQ
jgi:signal peptidase I